MYFLVTVMRHCASLVVATFFILCALPDSCTAMDYATAICKIAPQRSHAVGSNSSNKILKEEFGQISIPLRLAKSLFPCARVYNQWQQFCNKSSSILQRND